MLWVLSREMVPEVPPEEGGWGVLKDGKESNGALNWWWRVFGSEVGGGRGW